MGALARKIAERVAFLDGVKFQPNVICSHFGEHVSHANLSINIGVRGLGAMLLITIYDRRHFVMGIARHGHLDRQAGKYLAGQSRTIHTARAESVAGALGCEIIDRWNGEDGHNGISIVLARRCPAVVLTGIQNYCAMGSPFHLTDADRAGFEAYNNALEAQEAEDCPPST